MSAKKSAKMDVRYCAIHNILIYKSILIEKNK